MRLGLRAFEGRRVKRELRVRWERWMRFLRDESVVERSADGGGGGGVF